MKASDCVALARLFFHRDQVRHETAFFKKKRHQATLRQNECDLVISCAMIIQPGKTLSQPTSPRSRSGSAASSKFGWSRQMMMPSVDRYSSTAAIVDPRYADRRSTAAGFSPCLDNISIPYADDSGAGKSANVPDDRYSALTWMHDSNNRRTIIIILW
jgi:hypothetical protein